MIHQTAPNVMPPTRVPSTTPLFTCRTVWPFTFWTHSVKVYEHKIEIIYRPFLWSHELFPILIKDLVNIVVTLNPFFGTAQFELSNLELNPPPIYYLRRRDALKLKEVVFGLIAMQKDARLPKPQTRDEVEQLAQVVGATEVSDIPEAAPAPETVRAALLPDSTRMDPHAQPPQASRPTSPDSTNLRDTIHSPSTPPLTAPTTPRSADLPPTAPRSESSPSTAPSLSGRANLGGNVR